MLSTHKRICQMRKVIFTYRFDVYSVSRDLNEFAKSIDVCQPEQSAQADMGRNFSLCLMFCIPKDI